MKLWAPGWLMWLTQAESLWQAGDDFYDGRLLGKNGMQRNVLFYSSYKKSLVT